MGKLYAISDLHISHKFNLDAFHAFFAEPSPTTSPASKLYSCRHDGLILGGDVTEKVADLRHCFRVVTQIFAQVWWVPGNHELYTLPGGSADVGFPPDEGSDEYVDKFLRGEERYEALVEVARAHGVLTPEDDFVPFTLDQDEANDGRTANVEGSHQAVQSPGAGGEPTATTTTTQEGITPTPTPTTPSAPRQYLVCPIFTLYDYSFRPADVTRAGALAWAMEQSIQATDEHLLHPDPHPTRDAWCAALVARFAAKLDAAVASSRGLPLVIVNHWPLREDLVHIPLVPRFSLWCGTKATADWHVRFGAAVVVTGHLHVRRTDWKDGVRFEEVSLGYPRQWEAARNLGKGIGDLMREVLPGKDEGVAVDRSRTIWRGKG